MLFLSTYSVHVILFFFSFVIATAAENIHSNAKNQILFFSFFYAV